MRRKTVIFGRSVHNGLGENIVKTMAYGTEHTYSNSGKNENRTFFFYPPLRYNSVAKEDFAMKEIKRHLVLDDFEYRLLVGCVNKARTMFVDEGKPIEDVSALLLKIIDAPTKKIKIRS